MYNDYWSLVWIGKFAFKVEVKYITKQRIIRDDEKERFERFSKKMLLLMKNTFMVKNFPNNTCRDGMPSFP